MTPQTKTKVTEQELREKIGDLTIGRGFWHTKVGRELRFLLADVSFAEFDTVQEKVWSLVNRQPVAPTCVICGRRASFYQYSFLETCGTACGAALAQQRQPPTVIEARLKAAVQAAQTESAKARRRETLRSTHAARGDQILEETRATCQTRYGVSHPLKSAAIKNKVEQTNLERYGAKSALTSPAIKEKTREKKRQKYIADVLPGRLESIFALEQVKPRFTINEYTGGNEFYPWVHEVCGHEFSHKLVDGCTPTCPRCRPRSRPENAVVKLCEDLGLQVKLNDRTLIKPYELDIVCHEHKLAIEVNGAWWHHEGTPGISLLEKTRLVEARGYQLLHFWDYEVRDKLDIIRSIIQSKAGLNPCRVFARKTTMVALSEKEARTFLGKFHLNGHARAKHRFGLLHDGELVAVATFGPARFSRKDKHELIRFCCLPGTTVIGGLSRLVSHFTRQCPGELISFADRRISTGAGYLAAGFVLEHETSPNYQYVKGNARLPRQAAMKHKLPALLGPEFDDSLTERQNMEKAGWLLLADCGNLKFKFSKI